LLPLQIEAPPVGGAGTIDLPAREGFDFSYFRSPHAVQVRVFVHPNAVELFLHFFFAGSKLGADVAVTFRDCYKKGGQKPSLANAVIAIRAWAELEFAPLRTLRG
jgi:hypothetical protein